jgi:hypothetical protein
LPTATFAANERVVTIPDHLTSVLQAGGGNLSDRALEAAYQRRIPSITAAATHCELKPAAGENIASR